MKVIASNGTDTTEVIKVTYTDPETGVTGPFDFTTYGVTRVDVAAGGIVMSTGQYVSHVADKLTINFSKMGLVPGKYDVRVKIVSAASPDGVEIIGPLRPDCMVLFVS